MWFAHLRRHDPLFADGKRDPEAVRLLGDEVLAAKPHTVCGLPMQFFAGLSYCTSSVGMVLLNKLALSGFDFHSITSLLIFQCVFCVVAVRMCAALGLITLEVGCSLFKLRCLGTLCTSQLVKRIAGHLSSSL